MARFTVDTHLFRELGELLVGRNSTALIELVKNAYDADATEVLVEAESLDDPSTGVIVIADNGLGMTRDQFVRGFLRVAGRMREAGGRRSEYYGRRYTGAKGIGRLAAHKLARQIEVESVAVDPKTLRPVERIKASIDWDLIEEAETLDEVEANAIRLRRSEAPSDAEGGTTIRLSNLRRIWTPTERTRFISEAQSFRPNSALVSLPKGVLPERLLFSKARMHSPVRDKRESDPGWDLELLGDFDVGESYSQVLAQLADWVLEIEARRGRRVRFGIAPTKKWVDANGPFSAFQSEMKHPAPSDGPFFCARVLVREGQLRGQPREVQQLAKLNQGVQVFLEGFRVLPYGESGNDWLQIDHEYTQRRRGFGDLATRLFPDEDQPNDRDAKLSWLPNRAYFGGVFMSQEESGGLKMLINREGFVPDAPFDRLVDLVRGGVELTTRVRASASETQRRQRRISRQKDRGGDSGRATPSQELMDVVSSSSRLIKQAKQSLSTGDIGTAREQIESIEHAFRSAPEAAREVRDETALVRVLASVGTQMAGFVHEIQGLLSLATEIERVLESLRNEFEFDRATTRRFSRVITTMSDFRRSLERQASYLTDIVTPDSRRRRSRQYLRRGLASAAKLLEGQLETQKTQLINKLPDGLKGPPMFKAEIVALFTNLLSNAVKAAGKGGRIRASGRVARGSASVRLENTGKIVKPEDGERWFHPFETTTAHVRRGLGQGMGLGLTISRRIVEEYGGSIRFVQPSAEFATAIRFDLPNE